MAEERYGVDYDAVILPDGNILVTHKDTLEENDTVEFDYGHEEEESSSSSSSNDSSSSSSLNDSPSSSSISSSDSSSSDSVSESSSSVSVSESSSSVSSSDSSSSVSSSDSSSSVSSSDSSSSVSSSDSSSSISSSDSSSSVSVSESSSSISSSDSSSSVSIEEGIGEVCWGDDNPDEANIRDFTGNITAGSGYRIIDSGDLERVEFEVNGYFELITWEFGSMLCNINRDKYRSGSGSIIIRYKNGDTEENCDADGWNLYSTPFACDNWLKIRVEAA